MYDLYLYKSTHFGYIYIYLELKSVSGVFVKNLFAHIYVYCRLILDYPKDVFR